MPTDRLDLRTATGIWVVATRSGAIHALDTAARLIHRTPPPEPGGDPTGQPWLPWAAIGSGSGERDLVQRDDTFWYLRWISGGLRAHFSTEVVELREAVADDLAGLPPLAQ